MPTCTALSTANRPAAPFLRPVVAARNRKTLGSHLPTPKPLSPPLSAYLSHGSPKKKLLLLWIFDSRGDACFPSMRTQIVNPYRLAHHGIGTSASTGSVNTSNHNANAYEVQGQSYLRHQQGGAIGIGKTLPVSSGCGELVAYYLPEDPRVSTLGDPQALLLL